MTNSEGFNARIQPATKVNPNALLSPADVEQGNVRKNQVLPVTS